MIGPSRLTVLPDICKSDVPDGNDDAEQQFFMYIFKVQPCPKRGAHDWSSCPYAHPREKARRRDPRVYKYASTPCPESLKGVSCGRGVDCPYAHSVYEYWLHPARFRTQMCKKGNQCNRTLCFFAHSAAELRFPDTADDLEAAAVDAAAASATAGALPLVTATQPTASQTLYPGVSMIMAPGSTASNEGSSFGLQGIMGLSTGCSDASSMQLTGSFAGGSSYNVIPGQQQIQAQDVVNGYGLGGSDPNLRIPGIAVQQSDAQSLSDPLPHLADPNARVAAGNAAWLQMAAASQLPASQILSSISPPGAQQLPQLQGPQPMGLLSSAIMAPVDAPLQHVSAVPPMLLNTGSGLTSSQMDTLDRLSSGMGSINLADDNSTSSCLSALNGDQQYLAAFNACAAAAAAGRPIDISVLQQPVASPPKGSSNTENFVLLQQLQQQQQQQHLAKLGSGTGVNCGPSGSRQGIGGMYIHLGGMPAGQVAAQQPHATWGMRMA